MIVRSALSSRTHMGFTSPALMVSRRIAITHYAEKNPQAKLGALSFTLLMLFTTALCALIVYLMKGPAFVADAYYLEDSDLPK